MKGQIGLVAFISGCLSLLAACTTSLPALSLPQLDLSEVAVQEIHVVPAYEGVADYIQAVAENPDADRGALYLQHVVMPYVESCAGIDPEALPESLPAAAVPYWDFVRLPKTIAAIRESNVKAVIQKVLRRASLYLPAPETTVCVFPLEDRQHAFVRSRMHGVFGATGGAGKIVLQLEPVGDWMDWVPYTMAHEHHHSVAMARHGLFAEPENTTLLDAVVSEGRADSFARMLYPKVEAPWTQALTPAQEAEEWRQMQADLPSTDPEKFRLYLFGDGGAVPTWTGYTIGYHIVQSYLERHPDLSIEAWTAVDAEDLLREGGYD